MCKQFGRDTNEDTIRRKRYRDLESVLGVKKVEEIYDIGKTLSSLISFEPLHSLGETIKEYKNEYYNTESSFPRKDQHDVFQFLIDHSDISGWEKELLQMVHDTYVDWPLSNVMILHEGFATFVQEKYAIEKVKTDIGMGTKMEEMILKLADPVNEKQMRYSFGFRLFKYVEECWDKGRHGLLYDNLSEWEKQTYDNKEEKGLEKVLDIVKFKTDWDFIFAHASTLFINKYMDEITEGADYIGRNLDSNDPSFILSLNRLRELKEKYAGYDATKFKVELLTKTESYAPPVFIPKGGGNFDDDGGLLIKQNTDLIDRYLDGYLRDRGKEKDEENNIYSMLTLDNHRSANSLLRIFKIWKRSVYLQTINSEDGKPILMYTADGSDINYDDVHESVK